MTIVSPACDCSLKCAILMASARSSQRPKARLCEACTEAAKGERESLQNQYEERKAYLIATQTGFEDGDVTDAELIDLHDRLKRIERQLAVKQK